MSSTGGQGRSWLTQGQSNQPGNTDGGNGTAGGGGDARMMYASGSINSPTHQGYLQPSQHIASDLKAQKSPSMPNQPWMSASFGESQNGADYYPYPTDSQMYEPVDPDTQYQSSQPSQKSSPFANLFQRKQKGAAGTESASPIVSRDQSQNNSQSNLFTPPLGGGQPSQINQPPSMLSADVMLGSGGQGGQRPQFNFFGRKGKNDGVNPVGAAPLPASSYIPASDGSHDQGDSEEGYIFGQSLEVAVTRAGKHGVPDIVLACIEFLDQNGLSTEGLYRVPGSMRRVREWGEKFEAAAIDSKPGPQDDLPNVPPSTIGTPVVIEAESASTVASLLKRFFMKLKGGLIGSGTGAVWREMEANIIQNPAFSKELSTPAGMQTIMAIRNLLANSLPTICHLRTSAAYVQHLQRVASQSDRNLMTIQNISIVAFPNGGSGSEFLIKNAAEIFAGWDLLGPIAPGGVATTTVPAEVQQPTIPHPPSPSAPISAAHHIIPTPRSSSTPVPVVAAVPSPTTIIVKAQPPKVPVWNTEIPREFSELTFAAAKEKLLQQVHVQTLEASGHIKSAIMMTEALFSTVWSDSTVSALPSMTRTVFVHPLHLALVRGSMVDAGAMADKEGFEGGFVEWAKQEVESKS